LLSATCTENVKLTSKDAGPLSASQHDAHSNPRLGSDPVKSSRTHQSGYSHVPGASVSVGPSSVAAPSTSPPITTPSVQSWHVPAVSATSNVRTRFSVNAFNQQRDALAHGLDLGASGEKLGLGFLVENRQNIAKLRNNSSASNASPDGTSINLGSS